jgi:hypothetical protein
MRNKERDTVTELDVPSIERLFVFFVFRENTTVVLNFIRIINFMMYQPIWCVFLEVRTELLYIFQINVLL